MLIGNVGQDPEVRYLDDSSSSTKVATVRMATSERYRDRAGELHEITEWHSVVAWRNLADVIEKYVRKGTQIFVEGRLRTRSWEDQNGNRRYVTEVLADNIQLLGRRSDNPANSNGGQNGGQQGGYRQQPRQQSQPQYGGQPRQQPQQQYNAPAPQPAPQIPADEEDDDLPF